VAHADTGGLAEITVQPGDRWLPRQETLLTAGDSGYLAFTGTAFSWTGDDGATTAAGRWAEVNRGLRAWQPSGSPTVWLGDFVSTTTTAIAVPDGQTYQSAFAAGAILTAASDGSGLHVVSEDGGGGTTDRTVTGVPAGATVDKVLDMGGDLTALSLRVDGVPHVYLLDFTTATAREVFAGVSGIDLVVLGGTRVVAATPRRTSAYSVRLDDPSGTVEETPYPAAARATNEVLRPVPDGDRILVEAEDTDKHSTGGALWSVPVGGGDATLLLRHTVYTLAVAPDGSVLVVGGSGPADWAVRRIAPDGTVTSVTPLAPFPARVFELAYSAGRLVYSSDTGAYDPLIGRDVTAGATPSVSGPSTVWGMGPERGAHLQALGKGTVAFVRGDEVFSPLPGSTTGARSVRPSTMTMTGVLDGDGYDLVLGTTTAGRQAVGNLDNGYDPFARGAGASAVWDHTIWVPGSAAGTVRPYNLRTLAYGATVQTGAACANYADLQVDGRWLYWSCGTTAGVYDRTTGRHVAVPAGQALLGDGFVVRHTGGRLVMTDVHAGTAVTTDVADLPQGTQSDDRGVTWTVDKYAGGLAYVDAASAIHVIPSLGVPRSPSLPAARDYDSDGTGDLLALTPQGGLQLRPGTHAGGVGPGTDVGGDHPTGSMFVPTGDLTGDGCNDLLVRNPAGSGTLVREDGTCCGFVVGIAHKIGAGWNIYNSLVSPGDLTGDGRPDLLARTASGDLYLYAGNAAGVFAPRVKIGFGFQIYNSLVGAQDLNGDGIGDVLARDASGVLWRYDGDGKGGLKARVRIGAGWNAYNSLVGVGDINGDGRNDLVARDANGDLWRYDGLGSGLFAPRVKIGWAWQTYKSLL
ncbi:VCBS repeat-containing protein, partial [Actinacidiphila rubida]